MSYIEHMERVLDSYWVPLAGSEDIYIHFGIDITDYASERFLPKKCAEEGACCSCSGE